MAIVTENNSTIVEPLEMRNAMGKFLTGVTIVTIIQTDGTPYGLTVNSFNSVSLDPPLVLWSLDNRNGNLQAFRDADGFVVNVMASAQADLCGRFASQTPNRFDGVDWERGVSGHPVLNGCLASFDCRHWTEYEGGDHTIFIGEVVSIKQQEGTPAAYFSGKLGHYNR
ncbi:flavin reductase family protein [Candidatus Puniceispirillum marinum]|uniref:Flavin reductase-like, FMN-binding protein n=1 Tax=Puniceispirillum marinum (strain IMCC1322) TaxID=488538 RepID=D5BQW2_PUNMI|nr:flavin reductase family protein [Candidatus Puniceispirillum marinum]ADE38676.1 flavin reductase-like, FMN-binding protein [Candidatus Puniceispirillum marinum IMCC1322]